MSIREPALLAAVCLCAIIPAAAQTGLINCIVTAEAPLLRTENHAERVGDLRITCTGGDPNEVRFVNITLFLDAPITSDLTGEDADETEALLLIDDPQPGVLQPQQRRHVQRAGQGPVRRLSGASWRTRRLWFRQRLCGARGAKHPDRLGWRPIRSSGSRIQPRLSPGQRARGRHPPGGSVGNTALGHRVRQCQPIHVAADRESASGSGQGPPQP